jgi:hypothetical protein
MAASLKCGDYLVLMSNLPFITAQKAFGLLKHPFQFGAIHSIAYHPESTLGLFFCP